MSEPTRQVNVVNVASGICFVALGLLLLFERAGALEMRQIVELWPLVLVIVGAAVVWQASRGGTLTGSGACAGWLFWVVVLGFVMSHAYDRRAAAEAAAGAGAINVTATVGGAREAPTGPFAGGSVTTVVGGANLDLTRTQLAPGATAVLDVFVVMGGVELQVPADWHVEFETTTVAGGVTDERRRAGSEAPTVADSVDGDDADGQGDSSPNTDADDARPRGGTVNLDGSPVNDPPRLVLTGTVLMGGVTIK